MGKVSRDEAKRNRDKVVEAGGELIKARGLNGVSVDELMASAGLTRGSFYRMFESKEAMAGEAVTSAFEHAHGDWKEAISGDQAGKVTGLAEFYLAQITGQLHCPMVCLALEAIRSEDSAPLRMAYGAGADKLFSVIAKGRSKDRRALLFAALIGIVVLGQAGAEPGTMEPLRSAVRDLAQEIDQS